MTKNYIGEACLKPEMYFIFQIAPTINALHATFQTLSCIAMSNMSKFLYIQCPRSLFSLNIYWFGRQYCCWLIIQYRMQDTSIDQRGCFQITKTGTRRKQRPQKNIFLHFNDPLDIFGTLMPISMAQVSLSWPKNQFKWRLALLWTVSRR